MLGHPHEPYELQTSHMSHEMIPTPRMSTAQTSVRPRGLCIDGFAVNYRYNYTIVLYTQSTG